MTLSLDINDLEAAITEAYRFLGAAQSQVQALRNNGRATSKQNAKTWRASLDLSETLIHARRRK